jgi:protocatechuate 3,4-dioxygenase beta subunit
MVGNTLWTVWRRVKMKANSRALMLALLSVIAAGRSGVAQDTKFTPPPGQESADVKRSIDQAEATLRVGKSASDILTDPAFLVAHEWPRFRELIRRAAQSSQVTITSPNEPGTPLRVAGRVLGRDGQPMKSAEVYVYQTSAKGWYSDRAAHYEVHEGDRKHARIFGYLLTDNVGRFDLRTIRPAGYPGSNLPAHIHVEIRRPRESFAHLVTEVEFEDDPRLTSAMKARARNEGFAIIPVTKGADNVASARVDFKFP